MKYIIEVEDEPINKNNIYKAKNCDVFFTEAELKKLESTSTSYEEGYQDGLDDAWDCTKKIIINYNSHDNDEDYDKCYFGDKSLGWIMAYYTPNEAILKIKHFEELQKLQCEKCGNKNTDTCQKCNNNNLFIEKNCDTCKFKHLNWRDDPCKNCGSLTNFKYYELRDFEF